MLPWLLLIRGVTFIPFRLYHGFWRYAGIRDLSRIIVGVLASTLVFFAVLRWGLGQTGYPRSIFVIDSLVLISLMGGMRLGPRLIRQWKKIRRQENRSYLWSRRRRGDDCAGHAECFLRA